MPPSGFLLLLLAKFLSLCVFSESCKNTRLGAESLHFAFPKVILRCLSLWSLPGLQVWVDFMCMLTGLLQKFTLVTGASCEARFVWVRHTGHWHPQQLMVGPLWWGSWQTQQDPHPFDIFILRSGCWSPSWLLPLSCTAHDLVFWIGSERNGLLRQCVTYLGKWDTPSHTLILPHGRNHWLRRAFLALSCAGGGVMWLKSNCSSYLFQCILSQTFIFLQRCAGTSPVDSWTSTKILWLSELVFFRGFWTAAARGWSGFMGYFRVHIWDQYYVMHKWWESS